MQEPGWSFLPGRRPPRLVHVYHTCFELGLELVALGRGHVSYSLLTYHQQEHRLYDQPTGWCNSLALNRTIGESPRSALHCITRIHSQQISNRANLEVALESFPLAVAYLRRPPSREAQCLVAKWR